MCGRARCTLRREEVAALAGVPVDEFIAGDKYQPVENMGPGRYGAVVFRGRDAGGKTQDAGQSVVNRNQLQAMRWGLIPSFTKPRAKPDHFMMFNARSESLPDRPAFRRLLETKRCVVLCNGYYEWHQVDKREKQPYYIHRNNGPMKFAGLYDSWVNEDGDVMYSYTILTTEIAKGMAWMHTRMPVILTGEGVERWLSNAAFPELRDLFAADTGLDLKWHAVDRKVGSTKFQSEDCSKKVDINHAGNIKSFFQAAVPSKTEPRPGEAEPDPEHRSIAKAKVMEFPAPSAPLIQRPAAAPMRTPPRGSPARTASPKMQQHLSPPIGEYFKHSPSKSTAPSPARSHLQSSSSPAVSSPAKPLHFTTASALLRNADGHAGNRGSSKRKASSPKHPNTPSPKRSKLGGKPPPRGTLFDYFQPAP